MTRSFQVTKKKKEKGKKTITWKIHWENTAHFTLGVRANFQPKSSIPIGAKVEISPNGFTLEVKAEIEMIFSIGPELLINVELYGLVLAPRLKKEYHQIWEANL
jgi:hypothetical protein